MKELVAKWDIYIILILLIIAVFTYFIVSKGLVKESGQTCVISVDGETYGEYPLDEDLEIEVLSDDNTVTNTVVIKDSYVFMTDADCPDKLCVKQGKISKSGQMIVCLPNKVVVEIYGEEDLEIDGISQ